LRSRRGPSCDEASERATKVIEKTTPAIVIIDPAMAPSKELAPSAPPVKFKPQLSVNQSVTSVSRATVAKADTIAPPAMTAGRNQKLERTRFHVLKTCTLMMTPFHSFAGPARPNNAAFQRARVLCAPLEKPGWASYNVNVSR
jgi:hypothetical protein